MCSTDLRRILRDNQWTVVFHKELFEGETPDHEWIPVATSRGHTIITSDKKMQTWRAEGGKVRPTIERVGAKVFFLRGVGLTPQEQADAVNEAKAGITRHVKQCAGTFLISRIHSIGSRKGEIQILHRGGTTKTDRKYGPDALSELDAASD